MLGSPVRSEAQEVSEEKRENKNAFFRQLFDAESFTYTYLIASRTGGEAFIIDSVIGHLDQYLRMLQELDLKLVKVVDTHTHADQITGMGVLRDRTKCVTVMGAESAADVVSMRVQDGETIEIEGLSLDVIYTPGHTNDSYSFKLLDRVFTGDTLLICGTGRTDFQNGDAAAQYDSIFNELLRLPDETLVYPGHDYKGEMVSTIIEERCHNPRLQVANSAEYAEIMNGLNLANPKMMDVAVPANKNIGAAQGKENKAAWAL
jgi:sulfur dioxygenase